MKKFILLLSLLLLVNIASNAQSGHPNHHQDRCGHDHILSIHQNDPQTTKRVAEIEKFTQDWIANNQYQKNNTVVTIPVVIHVVWDINDSIQNISDAQIQSQLAVLNEDFRKQNADTSFIPSVFQSLAADTKIEFVLASTDPNGNPTTGINRISTTLDEAGSFNNAPQTFQLVPLWDTLSYMNIYVTEITDFGYLLGYATRPGMSFNGFDGIVMDYRYFGTIGTVSPPLNLGRTLTHEVGHYLNLLHLWGDNGGCSDDDLVTDTPDQDGPNYGCQTHPVNSCSSDDMFMNYMDYGDDPCLVMFSHDQKMRMLAALNGPRFGLLSSSGLGVVPSKVIYVNHAATGANDGTSWTDAYTDLGIALDSANQFDRVWVAQGTYLPGNGNPTDSSYFSISDKVRLYGGFDGTETELEQRNYILNETILSGDILGDDLAGDVITNRADNSLHVMIIDSTVTSFTQIDGVTIKGGQSEDVIVGNGSNRTGGGILSFGAPKIVNCIIKDNYAYFGGGLHAEQQLESGLIVENTLFLNNTAGHSGGGASCYKGSAHFTNCSFEGNEAIQGGAFRVTNSDIEIVNSLFENNTGTESAGAILGRTEGVPTTLNITGCDFIQNHAGGTFFGQGGGAIGVLPGLTTTVLYSIFDDNTSGGYGGAILTATENFTINNCLLINNEAIGEGNGGAICNIGYVSAATLTVTNSTIANNKGTASDGIFQDYFFGTSHLNLGNTILSNENKNYAEFDSSGLTLVNSMLGNVSSDSTLVHVLTHIADMNNTDPLFESPFNDDFRLTANSPGRDLGVQAFATAYDLDSVARISHPDAGAYEYPFAVATEELTTTFDEELKAYPNPSVDKLTLEMDNEELGEIRFQLVDATGKLIRTWSDRKNDIFYQQTIPVKGLDSGLYQIIVTQEKVYHTVRFMKL